MRTCTASLVTLGTISAMIAFKMTTSSTSILHLFLSFIILVSGCIATAAFGNDEILPERKIAKQRMRGRLRGTTSRRKLGSSSIIPTKEVLTKRETSEYKITTLATKMVVLRTTPTIRTGVDQRRKLKKQRTRQRTIRSSQK
jgi:hypothetical protein